jgi:FtsP/CotA-like multicopper oxidase with cupredoxin domain
MPTPEGSRLIPIAVEGSTLPNVQPVAVTASALPPISGVYSYYSGASGTVNVAAGQRVTSITAKGTSAWSMSVAGGPTINGQAGDSVTLNPNGNLTAPSITFTGTSLYIIEVVS